ncbi:MAG: hypothetical protein LBF61_04890 [Azoarcus sp.]|jgi:hypothetical protein|nr:hypothetical protein [Azoarcus sp.]
MAYGGARKYLNRTYTIKMCALPAKAASAGDVAGLFWERFPAMLTKIGIIFVNHVLAAINPCRAG